jgi:pimeloyl-ACP methyl ester carboxylesterase
MVAASDPSIAAVVILAGTATNGYLIIEYQWRYQLDNTPGLSDDERKYQEEVIDKKVRNMRDYFARGEGTPWEKSFVSYSPLTSARKLHCPVLILHGDRDAHVPVEHSSMLAQAIRANGNQDVTVIIFKNHNHLLLKDPDGRKSEYSKLLKHTNQLSQNVLNTISDWVVNRLKGGT